MAAGIPSFELMLRAGTAAAAFILRELPDSLARGVALHAGAGNNGGDAYIVAAQLARAGVVVRLAASAPPRTSDAIRAAALAAPALKHGAPTGQERLVVDGLLGTGHRGELRDALLPAVASLSAARDRGATVVALDVPSGLDATTGEVASASVRADVTLSFGTLKRGTLFQRAHAGRIALLDIGVGRAVAPADIGATRGQSEHDVAWRVAFTGSSRDASAMPSGSGEWNAHKRTRGYVGIVGGAWGMAGATALAGAAALHTGAGLVQCVVARESLPTVQQLVPQAIAAAWTEAGADDRRAPTGPDMHALAIGPGLGRGPDSLGAFQGVLRRHPHAAVVLDADALTMAADDSLNGDALEDAATRIATWMGERAQVVLTPHPGEFTRLIGRPIPDAWEERAETLMRFATRARAVTVLKGSPTLIASPDSRPIAVMARGNALLATGGSGDTLTGVIAALLASGMDGSTAAELGTTIHGVAAEIVAWRAGIHGRDLRGVPLSDVANAIPEAMRVTLAGALHDLHDGHDQDVARGARGARAPRSLPGHSPAKIAFASLSATSDVIYTLPSLA